jgi:serine/threonine-protein kinase
VPILSLPDFVRQVRSLELVDPTVLDKVLQEKTSNPGEDDAHALARTLMARSYLTPYQVNHLLRGRGQELVIGQYVLLDRLGQGGMGKVFKAIHRGMRRLVALKVIHPDLMLNEEVVTRFYREIRLVGQFSHPNIVHAYDAGPVGKVHALAMEYIEGTDLGRHVKRCGPLDVARACDYVQQTADGLQYAFERGLVHRDIKPHNLLVVFARAGGERDVIKILDLGLARLQRPDSGNSSMVTPSKAAMMGTPDFLAPEQAVDFHAADTRSDIYSLGCTLFFLLTGRPPFTGGTIAEKLLRHQMMEPPDLGQRADVPAALAQLVRRMLAKRPEDRLQTPGDVARALRAYTNAPSDAITLTERVGDAETVEQPVEPFSDLDAVPQAVPVFIPTQRPGRYRLGLYLGIAAAVLVAGAVIALPTLFSSFKDRASAVKPGTAAAAKATETPVAEDPLFKGALAYWKMDEGRGTRVADASGRNNHATLHQAGWVPGTRGKAVHFDTEDSYLAYGTSPDFNFGANAPFTFAGWVKTTAQGGAIVSQRHDRIDGADIDVELVSGVLCAIVRTDSYIAANVRARPINDGRWHHFALARTGDSVLLYLDGKLEDRASVSGVGGSITTNLRAVGSERLWALTHFQKQPQYRGSVAEFCIFGRELSGDEVKELMRRTGPR